MSSREHTIKDCDSGVTVKVVVDTLDNGMSRIAEITLTAERLEGVLSGDLAMLHEEFGLASRQPGKAPASGRAPAGDVGRVPEQREAANGATTGPGRPTPALLSPPPAGDWGADSDEERAQHYRRLGCSPTRLAEFYGVPGSTIAPWLSRCRKRGLRLPAAKKGGYRSRVKVS